MYVDIDSRDKYYVRAKVPINPDGLSYQLTQLVVQYVSQNQDREGLNSTLLNEVVGALESVKQEFYRRAVVPFNSNNIKDNGDLYS